MDNLPRPRQFRQYILDRLARLAGNDPTVQNETLLIRNGIYCGHRFKNGGYEAVWFVDEGQVKFFGPSGELLQTAELDEIWQQTVPQAA